jgi:hypothetical protein
VRSGGSGMCDILCVMERVLTYDARMVAAARSLGLPVLAPA